MEAFIRNGNRVLFLTQLDGKSIIPVLTQLGVECYALNAEITNKIGTFLHTVFLIKFCWRHRVDTIFSHLEPANLCAVLANYFIAGKVITVRHHVDEAFLNGDLNYLSNRLIYKLSPAIITVSDRSAEYMITEEKIPRGKIRIIPLSYNFELYKPADSRVVASIKEKHPDQLILVEMCRLVPTKRPMHLISLAVELTSRRVPFTLYIAGSGPLEISLHNEIVENKLQSNCILLGRIDNVMDYLEAADFLIHPSVSESSCVVVKESALVGTPVIYCRGVGDCDEYVENGVNGFLVDPDNFVAETATILQSAYQGKLESTVIGQRLKETIIKRFSINTNIDLYKNYM